MIYLKAFAETLLTFFLVVAGIYSLIRWFQTSRDEPRDLARKLVITLILLGFTVAAGWVLGLKDYAAGNGTSAAAIFPFVAVFLGLALSVIWTPNIAEWLVRPITSAFDGGNEVPDRKPFYSVARALRAKGRYPDAVAEVEKQLANFPDDFEGRLLLAEIQLENLHDLTAAEATVEAICATPKQTPQNIAAALNRLADWHLKFAKDHIAARRDLEQIVELCPDSEAALGAAQRIAHLGAEEKPWSLRERRKVFVPEGIKSYGLVKEHVEMSPPEINPEKFAEDCVKHLEQHPLDNEAREQLAIVYADHYQRLDLATQELEQMISLPGQPARNVAHWLNLLADLQIRCANDYKAARKSLQRIVERFPNASAAELARNRIELLPLEIKAKGKSQAVKLGSYEQNIGLKYGPPQRP